MKLHVRARKPIVQDVEQLVEVLFLNVADLVNNEPEVNAVIASRRLESNDRAILAHGFGKAAPYLSSLTVLHHHHESPNTGRLARRHASFACTIVPRIDSQMVCP